METEIMDKYLSKRVVKCEQPTEKTGHCQVARSDFFKKEKIRQVKILKWIFNFS